MRYISRQTDNERYHTFFKNNRLWVEAYMISKTGLTRSKNEDCFGFSESRLVVADGIGGCGHGEIASKMTVEGLLESLLATAPYAVNQQILNKYPNTSAGNMPGSTVVALELGKETTIYSLGDSRAYLLRNNALEQLTTDHSEGALKDCKAHNRIKGRYTGEDKLLVLSLGLRDLENRVERAKREYSVKTTITQDIQHNDTYLLCTDGLTDVVDDILIKNCMNTRDTLEGTAFALIGQVYAKGAHDNVTIALVKCYDLKKLGIIRKIKLGLDILKNQQGNSKKLRTGLELMYDIVKSYIPF